MSVQHYSDLIAWQKSIDMAVEIYRASGDSPPDERFGLTNQVRRAAVSVPCNIAEGQGRSTTKDFVHFLHISRGSLQEVETQIVLANRLRFLADDCRAALLARTTEVSRILNGLIRSLS